MNLIEQLGGFEEASIFLKKRELHLERNDYPSSSVGKIKTTITELKAELLNYRRANNIYEVGDSVVLIREDQFNEVYKYDAFRSGLHWFESDNDYGFISLDRVRHATPQEIAAGRRL